MKKVKIKFSILTDYEVPDHYDEGTIDFYLTENLCVNNIINKLHDEIEEGICSNCAVAEVEIVD